MSDGRRASLLDFAITASVGIVPMLLVVLLGIGAAGPTWRQRLAADTHMSVRQVAALKTFEHAIVRRDSVAAGPPNADALVAQVPECGAEWSGRDSALERVKGIVGRTREDGRSPARRIAAQLGGLDEALARMSAGGNRRIVDAVGFDGMRWSDAARRALATPIEVPEYPGRSFNVRCSDLASAAATLSRGNGRMLGTLAWRGTEVERTVARWRPDQHVEISARHLARSNPWAGIPGCVYLANTSADGAGSIPAFFVTAARSAHERVCSQPSMHAGSTEGNGDAVPKGIAGEPGPETSADDARWQVPPSLQALLKPLDPLVRPSGTLAREHAPHRIMLDGAPIDVGFSVDLTIDPALQSLAQKTAACYTGRQDVCRALGIRRAEDGSGPIGHRLLEHAVVRMAAIAVIDVRSGRIEALAGAMTPCTRQEYDGPGRGVNCDARLPYPIRYRPDALLNAAVFHDAMPASLVKPVMAAAFLSNASVGPRWLAAERTAMRTPSPPTNESLRGQLARSSSARFLDRMFCADQGFRPCERPWEIQAIATAFGWNAGCGKPTEDCGTRDLLFGRSAEGAGAADARDPIARVPFGRLLVEPVADKLGAPFRSRSAIALDTTKIARCASGADGRRTSDDDWEKCKGGVIVDIVAEGWGQGHARSTALGAAGMMAALAAAANGEGNVRKPHLVRALRGVGGVPPALEAESNRWIAAATEPIALSRDIAEVILSGLSYSHRRGTARLACEQVLDARTCRDIDWIAGKTGTPTFPNDERPLDELAKLCAPGVKRTRSDVTACGGLRPYKWYAAAYRTDRADPGWSKAIGVLTERNWVADTGRVHGAGDHGPNPAAEIAFQIASRQTGAVPGDVR